MIKKSVSDSKTVQTRLVMPPDTNHLNTIFGGKVLAYIDEIAALTAMKHANSAVVTASIDSVDFLSSAKVGDSLTLEACVTYTGTSSMEVYVKVSAHDLIKNEKKLTTESFLTMVAVNEDGQPIQVPQVYPESEEEKLLHTTAPARKENRKRRNAYKHNTI
ncbi:acyl-CoA thioesterase [Oceanobacillus massiliensis]|uniref:acyl-CoA thioesterase n=1 Tax=Oceanobacillus massiliensis TaxID=1465765 RepID=UPI00028A35A6|nr:acyl-CoA thioesterase [Oceanobacillus massiliensis]